MNGKMRWIPVRNVSGEVIPPRAAMEPVSKNADGSINVTKPNKDDSNTALINGDGAIAINGGGFGTWGWPVISMYSSSSTPSSNGMVIGTRAGRWELYPGYDGFIVWGKKSTESYVVQRSLTCHGGGGGVTYGSGSGGHVGNSFCCECERFTYAGDSYTSTFPASLTGTATIPCIGTRSVTMPRQAFASSVELKGCNQDLTPVGRVVKAYYVGIYVVSGGDLFEAGTTDCRTGVGDLGFYTPVEDLQIDIACMSDACGNSSDDPADDWWWIRYFWTVNAPGIIRNVYGNLRGVIASCSPLAFHNTGTITCYKVVNEFDPCPSRLKNTNYTTEPTCIGSSVQIDIDE